MKLIWDGTIIFYVCYLEREEGYPEFIWFLLVFNVIVCSRGQEVKRVAIRDFQVYLFCFWEEERKEGDMGSEKVECGDMA